MLVSRVWTGRKTIKAQLNTSGAKVLSDKGDFLAHRNYNPIFQGFHRIPDFILKSQVEEEALTTYQLLYCTIFFLKIVTRKLTGLN